ncbi:hypothetical protein ALP76_200011 [Pseudomonas savastanoi pv. glycinea]|uniref:Phage integrase n=1 Tax=Pseudomonas savastanoi pv. glycinea TaxID=318 RepID=A0A3M3G8Q3_PSESG|nr:site-specific integrase [Pseudomonas savastanoi]MBN4175439.1 Tyrosine recombinase XerC [Pseudomonas savastanoi pv. phaseolicola]RMM70606.1 Phage integrase [Pseudomonas savastanoi pv. glycinea]RMR86495.1 hypothetical protein ALP76_200011 [Pseudomonas savastanoi pv. glycinea]
MSKMKVKRYSFNFIPFITIVDEMDLPVDPYVSCYINGHLSGKSTNTKLRYANELLFVLRFFQGCGVDLTARFASGELIGTKEYIDFYDGCCLDMVSISKGPRNDFFNVTDKLLRNLLVANQRGVAKVSSETLQGRIRRFRHYAEWLFGQFHDVGVRDNELNARYKKLVSKVKLDKEGLCRNRSHSVENAGSVIPDDVFSRLLNMIKPSSPDNPFKASKLRNYLIVSLLARTGMRRGALAKLKISDAQMWGTYDQISVYRSGNDLTDPRTDKPNQKTKAHLATISPVLMKHIQHYVESVRLVFPKAHLHEFIFVSENDSKGTMGEPLSLKSINSIFRKLSSALGFYLHPHMLRHKWNEIFDEEGNRQGINSARLEDLRKYAMGWSQNSTMNQKYNEKQLAMKTRELLEAHQKKMDQR